MTIFDIEQYLLAQRLSFVEVLNIGEGRIAKDGPGISTNGHLDFMWKLASFARRGYLIHLETNGHNFKSWLSALVCVFAGCLNDRRTIIAFGSGNLPAYLKQVKAWRRLIAKAVISLAGVVICRNQRMMEAIQSVGKRQDRIEIVPGFMGLQTRKPVTLSSDVQEFCATRTPLLGAAVGLGSEYGVSLALQAIQRLRHKHPKLGLVLLGIGPEATEHLPELAAMREHVLLAGEVDANVAVSVMRRLDLFLRPTFFDGDSLSVREALALGIPVVASNTGLRPKEVVLFEKGSAVDLEDKLNYALQHRDQLVARQLNDSETRGGIDLMMQIYRRLALQ